MKAIIMAAGQSTRTYPLTLTRPKPLLKIANVPILAHQLNALRGIVDEAFVVVNYRRDQIESAFGARYENIRLTYVLQPEPRGTGDAVFQCAGRIDEPFLAMNGDDLYDPQDLERLAKVDQAALVKQVDDPRLYGIYEVDSGRAVRIVEKPVEIFSNLANVGAYKFEPTVFDVLRSTPPSQRGEIEITSAIQTLADQGDFRVVEMQGYWLAIGYPWHLLDANEYFLNHHLSPAIEGDVSPRAELNGPIYVAPGARIRSGVVIDGPAYIGRDAYVGPNCWIRASTTIGDECRVGQCCEIKNSILFDRAAVPHLSYVGDSVIGERTNLGAGTITANFRHDAKTINSMVKGAMVDSGRTKLGAIIGDDVHTGIHTSIFPGRKIWPGAVTFPGEAIRKDVTEIKRVPQR